MARNEARNAEIVKLVAEGMTHRAVAKKLMVGDGVVSGVISRSKGLPVAGNVEDETEGNTRTVSEKTVVLHTLEDLLDYCEVDLDEWAVTKHIVNFWGNSTNPNTQIKAWLARIVPVEITPAISPVQVKIRKPPAKKVGDKATNVGRALILNDPHFGFRKSLRTGGLDPFHDRGALDVALQIAQYVRPDIIVSGGDILDLADWSEKFARSPNMYWTTQPSALEAAWWLGQFRQTTPEMKVIEGNHDARMERLVISQLKEAFGLRAVDNMAGPPLLSVPGLLGLVSMDIEYIGGYPDGKVWIGEQVKVIHGNIARAKSGQTIAALLADAQVSTVQGHIHRIELAYKTVHGKNQKIIGGMSTGGLCRIDGVVPAQKEEQNWQQGIGIVDFWDGGSELKPIPINDGSARFEGKTFEARDRVSELRDETGWVY